MIRVIYYCSYWFCKGRREKVFLLYRFVICDLIVFLYSEIEMNKKVSINQFIVNLKEL